MSNLAEKTVLAGESAAAGDLLHLVDVSDTTDNAAGTDVRMTLAEFHETYPVVISSAMTGSGAHATQDKLAFWDNGVPKTILVSELHAAIIALAAVLAGAGAHATEDHVMISDNGVSKKMLVTELQIAMVALATAITTGAHATQDHIPYDDNGVAKKITIPNLMQALYDVTTSAFSGSGVDGAADKLLYFDAGVPKVVTIAEFITAMATLGFTLANIPEYADQAAAATGLTGTGRLWRQAATGLLGVTIT